MCFHKCTFTVYLVIHEEKSWIATASSRAFSVGTDLVAASIHGAALIDVWEGESGGRGGRKHTGNVDSLSESSVNRTDEYPSHIVLYTYSVLSSIGIQG